MKRLVILVLASTFGASCSTSLTTAGANIKLLSENQKSSCQSVGVVTGSSNAGATPGHNAENAMNEVRNEAAELGGNALEIIGTTASGSAQTVIGEAFICEF